jgi:hypothetical protein
MKRLTAPSFGWGLYLLAALAAFAVGALATFAAHADITLPTSSAGPAP